METSPVKPQKTLQDIESDISNLKVNIWSMKAAIEHAREDEPHLQEFKDRLLRYENEMTDLEKQKSASQP